MNELVSFFLRKRGDSNPRYGYPYVSLANWWFQPLTHTSRFVSDFASANIVKDLLVAKPFTPKITKTFS